MIFIHLLIGIILGNIFGYPFFFILGSILPDIDHIYIIIKNKLFHPRKLIDSLRYEKKYNLHYKTPFFHSILGLLVFSAIIFLFSKIGAIFFALAYLLHLLIDWLDIDEKYFLYPLKTKFSGFLSIWSRTEQIITILLLILLILLYS